jgi:hypothetical protein
MSALLRSLGPVGYDREDPASIERTVRGTYYSRTRLKVRMDLLLNDISRFPGLYALLAETLTESPTVGPAMLSTYYSYGLRDNKFRFCLELVRRGLDAWTDPQLLLELAKKWHPSLPEDERRALTQLFEKFLRDSIKDAALHRIYINAIDPMTGNTVLDAVQPIPEWAYLAEVLRSQGFMTGEELRRVRAAEPARAAADQARAAAEQAREEAELARQTKRFRTDFSAEINSEPKRIELLSALRRTKAAGGKRTSLREGGGFVAVHMTSMALGTPSDDIFIVYGHPPTEEHTVVAEIRVKGGLSEKTTTADLDIVLKGLPAVAEAGGGAAAAGGAGHSSRRSKRSRRSSRKNRSRA